MANGKVSNKAKLHRQLADTELLRIYRTVRERSKCVICATECRDPNNHKVVTKRAPTLAERMENPFATNGALLDLQWWLQVGTTGEIIGPCGENCGGRAVLGSWVKNKRDEMRQQLAASGVAAAEIEDRLEQLAHQEWRKMLSVYRKAERDAAKLKISTNSLTYDEIIAAIAWEKEAVRLAELIEDCNKTGIPTEFKGAIAGLVRAPKGGSPAVAWEVDGVVCSTAVEVEAVVSTYWTKKRAATQAAAQVARTAHRQTYWEHVQFIEWAIKTGFDTTGPNFNALASSYRDRSALEQALQYIDLGNPFASTLQRVEEIAHKARQWPEPWQDSWPHAHQPAPQPVAPAQAGAVACERCGAVLVRKTGFSKYRRKPYDFYGCSQYPKCDFTMTKAQFEQAVQALAAKQAGPVVTPDPNIAAIAAMQPPVVVAPPKKPDGHREAVARRKRGAYWS